MKRRIIWILINALFVSALWLGYQEGISGARNVAAFFVWFSFGVSFLAMAKPVRDEMQAKGPTVPLALNGWLDAAIVLFLVWHGHAWMGGAYAFHTLMLHGAYHREAA